MNVAAYVLYRPWNWWGSESNLVWLSHLWLSHLWLSHLALEYQHIGMGVATTRNPALERGMNERLESDYSRFR